MASTYIGINRGQLEGKGASITAGTASGSTDFELRIDTGKSSTKEDVVKAMRAFELYILGNGMPGGQTGTFIPPN